MERATGNVSAAQKNGAAAGSGSNLPKLNWDPAREESADSAAPLSVLRAATPRQKSFAQYTARDFEVAAEEARERALRGGAWISVYSETGVQKRDFLQDLRRQRARDKGKEASGPTWEHLGGVGKKLSMEMELPELIEALKLFASVRHPDYDLYMRLLGELPRFVGTATAEQLCTLIRILARRRLREPNYVDMISANLLRKLRLTDDLLPPRLLVKFANALAALECRSNPRFVESFLRHVEHRIDELGPEHCAQVSTLFVVSYMNDSLRRCYLGRAAETQAGFHQGEGGASCRALSLTEFALRKEHHSLVSSLPPFVVRYLEKLRQHCAFDGYISIALPTAAAPNGPRGNDTDRMVKRLQAKVAAQVDTTGEGKRPSAVDVFSSDMHRDVSACLSYLGVEHENGVRSGPYLMDAVAVDMVNPEKRIVYEVNAPHHYYEGTEELLAERKLRHRMLNRSGQRLVHLDAKEWLPLSQAQRMNFLLQKQQAQQERNEAATRFRAGPQRASAGPVGLVVRPGTSLCITRPGTSQSIIKVPRLSRPDHGFRRPVSRAC